jgi:para-nitrobenzyl esterase
MPEPEIVRTSSGQVRGRIVDGVHRFVGMPYAQPPVGELRWRPPQPAVGWDGIRDATEFAAAPIQTINMQPKALRAEQSEDCLYINVWTGSVDPKASQPVMFWIHGGGFINGATSAPPYDGAALARRGVTVVSVGYRLGVFGFFNHPDAGTNFGVLDWVAGLEWVRDNIAQFGGDPNNVTVFGQSAGAVAGRTLLSSPLARGLFHRAIIQSGGFEAYAHISTPSFDRTAHASRGVCERVGTTDLNELRQLPTEVIREASLAESGIFPPPGQVPTPANLVWYPTMDGETVLDGFDGWPEDVPVMIGCLADEARMFIMPNAVYAHPEVDPADAYTPQTLRNMIEALAGPAADDVSTHYAGTGVTPYEALAELVTAAVWLEPAAASLRRFAGLGRTVYYYLFSRVSPGAEASGQLAFHLAEIPYVFGHVTRDADWELPVIEPSGYFDDRDAQVEDAVQTAWTSFARDGVPVNPDGTSWPAFDADDPWHTEIGDKTLIHPFQEIRVAELIRGVREGKY